MREVAAKGLISKSTILTIRPFFLLTKSCLVYEVLEVWTHCKGMQRRLGLWKVLRTAQNRGVLGEGLEIAKMQ